MKTILLFSFFIFVYAGYSSGQCAASFVTTNPLCEGDCNGSAAAIVHSAESQPWTVFVNVQGVDGMNAPVTTCGSVYNATIGSQVKVPVKVSNFKQIGAVSLRLYYNPVELTFDSVSNRNPVFLNNILINNNSVSSTRSYLATVWADVQGISLENGEVLYDMYFKLNSSTATLTFDNTNYASSLCEYANYIGDVLNDFPTSSYYKNGIITTGSANKSNNCNILSFTLPQQTGPAIIDTFINNVTIEVAQGTSLASLTPTITTSANTSISPASGTPQNFSNPFEYLVTPTVFSNTYTYQWSTNPVQTSSTATGLCAGTYNVTISNGQNCNLVSSVTLNPVTTINTTINKGDASCGFNNGFASLNASSGALYFSYLWSNGINQSTISHLSPGWYFVSVTSNNNCTTKDSVEILISGNQIIDIDLGQNIAMCLNSTDTISAHVFNSATLYDSLNYSWSSTGLNNPTILISPNASDYIYVTVTSGSCTGKDSIFVSVLNCQNTISGIVFKDDNGNGTKDAGESPMPGIILNISPINIFCSTDSSGYYSANVDTGNFTITMPNPPPHFNITTPLNTASFTTLYQVDSTNYFGLNPIILNDMMIWYTGGPVRPGFEAYYHIYYKNIGNTTLSGNIKFVKDPNLNFVSSLPPVSSISADTLIWNYTNLLPEPGEIHSIFIKMSLPQTVNLGTVLQTNATIFPVTGDTAQLNNFFNISQVVTGSYDPNDKSVTPAVFTPEMVSSKMPLIYKIRFQNTGTDTAFTVRLLDTLSQNVNIASFNFIGASHNCTWKIYGQGILEFTFNNILLPCKSTNEPASNGHVMYSITANDSLSLGDTITNIADIFFDYNSPIRTNMVTSVVLNPVSSENVEIKNDMPFSVFPNPISIDTKIQYTISEKSLVSLELFNVLGESKYILLNRFQNEGTYSISLGDNLNFDASGIYFVRLKINNKQYSVKVVKTN